MMVNKLDNKELVRKSLVAVKLILSFPLLVVGRLGQIIANQINAPKKTFYQLEKLAYQQSAQYIFDNMQNCLLFTDLKSFWTHAITNAPRQGLVMEFGVFKGNSINYFANQMSEQNDQRHLFGFDAFEGLSGDWTGYSLRKSKFDRQGKLPSVEDNVTLVKGWVNDTYEDFLESHLEKFDNTIAFMHLDMDIYEPTKFVLEKSIPYLQPGSIIAFDELLGYTGWRENEFKAMIETIEANFNYQYISFSEHRKLGYVSMYTRAALKIISPLHDQSDKFTPVN